MKKLLFLAGFLLFCPLQAHAFQTSVWLSSNTAATVSTSTLCGAQTYVVGTSTISTPLRGILHGICINTAGTGSIQVFSSSFSATGSITGLFSTGTQAPCNFYDTESVSGLSYNKIGAADVTILYQCY